MSDRADAAAATVQSPKFESGDSERRVVTFRVTGGASARLTEAGSRSGRIETAAESERNPGPGARSPWAQGVAVVQ